MHFMRIDHRVPHRRARARRAAILTSTIHLGALVACLSPVFVEPAHAGGGRGGDSSTGSAGGRGGVLGGAGQPGDPGGTDPRGTGGGGGGGGTGGGPGGAGGLGFTLNGNGGNGGTGGTFGFSGATLNSADSVVGGGGRNGTAGEGGGGGGGGEGGHGAYIIGGGNHLNSADVTGGNGGDGGGSRSGVTGSGGDGGVGAFFFGGGTFTNRGTVSGGSGARAGQVIGGGTGSRGIDGNGGTGVVGVRMAIVNTSGATISGGRADSSGRGGDGISGADLTVSNAGRIEGGGSFVGPGGSGIFGIGRLDLNNTGTIRGGAGGGFGIDGGSKTVIVNSGIIFGGDAGTSASGVAVNGSNMTITNTGLIQGGTSTPGNAGPAIFGEHVVIDNSGTIAEGQSGTAQGAIIVSDATILNSGTINGGISFFGSANSLTITSTSVITGIVFAASRNDTLGLGGDTNGAFNLAQMGPSNQQYQGFGILQKSGASIWTLSGAPSGEPLAYQVLAGTLNLGGTNQTAASLLLAGGTLAGGTLTSAGAFDVQAGTISANLAGTGTLTKSTAGTAILTGTNTYTGATNVNGGTLQVDGTIASPNVTVNAGGTLSGVGKIGDPQINAGGTLAPGNAANRYGTLTIVGPLGFAPGSFYNVAISSTQNSRTNVVGTTTIRGGTVKVAAAQGSYGVNTRYTILEATAGVRGSFAGVTTSTVFAFLTPTLTYGRNNVFLTILPSNPTSAGTPNYTTAASTRNQFNVASGLTQAGIQSDGRGPVLRALNQLTTQQARDAFDGLSGEGVTAAQNVAFRSAQLFTSSIFDQTTFYAGGGVANSVTLTERLPGFLALAPSERAPLRELADLPAARVEPAVPAPVANRTWRAWATGFGGIENISGDRGIGSASQRNDIFGGSLGVDYQLLPNYLVGVAIGGSNGNFRVDQRGTSGSTTGGHVAIYDLLELGPYYGASSTAFSYFGNQTTRFVSGFGGLGSEQNRGNFNSTEFRSRLEFGRHFSSLPSLGGLPTLAGFGTVTPFVALEIAQLRSNGFTETPLKGGPGLFRLNVSGQSAASAPAYAGLRFQRVILLGDGMVLSPTLQVAYVHEFAPFRNQVGTIASLPGSTFLVDGARPARNAAQVKAGGELQVRPGAVIFANFDGELSGINQLYAGKGGFRWIW